MVTDKKHRGDITNAGGSFHSSRHPLGREGIPGKDNKRSPSRDRTIKCHINLFEAIRGVMLQC